MEYYYNPLYIKYPLICLQILLFISVIISNCILWIFLKKSESPSTIFIKTVIIATVPAVGFGHLLFTIIYIQDYLLGSINVCNITMVINYAVYLSPCISILHVTALMIYHRYLVIANKNTFNIKTNTKTAILVVLLYSMFLDSVIVYEMYMLYITSNSLTNCKIAYTVKYEQCLFKDFPTPCFTPLTDIIITISITYTSLIVRISSKKLKQHIKSEMKKIERRLGQKQTMNFKRIKASHYLWISFTSFWLPWGFARLSFSLTSNVVIPQIVNDVCQTLSVTIYFTIPLVYYYMDSNFNKFARQFFSKKVKSLIDGPLVQEMNIIISENSAANPFIISKATSNNVILPMKSNDIITALPCTNKDDSSM